MSFLSDIFEFDIFNAKRLVKNFFDKPDQTLLGAQDPLGAIFWSKITGKDYVPNLNIWGGPSDETYATPGMKPGQDAYSAAEREGINTGPGELAHDIAETVSAFYTMRWAGGLGGGESAAGIGGGSGGSAIPSSIDGYMGGIGGGSGGGATGTAGKSFMSSGNLQNIGQGIQVFGQLFGAASDADQGRQSLRAAEYQAAQLRVNAGQAKAVAQREAMSAEEQAKLVASRALAVAAASGGGATDPTVIRIISGIEEEGAYRKALALYEGEAMARELRMKASTIEYQGKLEKSAANKNAFGGLLGGIAQGVSLFSKFGGGSPGAS